MSKRDVNLYGSFRDWFRANIDAGGARTLREHGASCGVGGLCHYSETRALFDAFRDEIERLAIEGYETDLWRIAKQIDAGSVTQLINALVWKAAELLAYHLEWELDSRNDEVGAEQEADEGVVHEI